MVKFRSITEPIAAPTLSAGSEDPPAFIAVTYDFTIVPSSTKTVVYVVSVAPDMATSSLNHL